MSFKDNFTREDKQNDLEYDISAFWTFGATFLLILSVPLLNNIKNCVFYYPEIMDEQKYINCKCSNCKLRLDKYVCKKKKEQKGLFFAFKLIIFTTILYLLYLSYDKIIQGGGQLKGFNPFEILEIDENADDKTIKRAFRRLSVTYHPDKNSNPDAKAKFIKITKAYEALTDPIAKENFKKYGNPDGAGNMRIGIALPPFVYDKKNHMPILVLFLIFIIFVLPIGFYYWYVTENSIDENGVRPENKRIYYELLNENTLLRHMPFIIGSSIEFSDIKVTSDEIETLNKLFKNYKDRFPKHNEKDYTFPNYKAICLIYNSIEKEIVLNDYLLEETNKVMCRVPDLLLSMYKMAYQLTILYYQYCSFNQKNAIKYFGLNCLRTIIEFSQCAHQQLKLINSSPFLQIPFFTNDTIAKLKKSDFKKYYNNFNDFKQFLDNNNEDRTKMLSYAIDDSKKIPDIVESIKMFPCYEVQINILTEGYDEILYGDIVTITIILKRNNLEEEKEIGFGHCNENIDLYHDNAAVFLLNNEMISFQEILSLDKKENKIEFKQMINSIGEHVYKLEVYPFSIKGLNYSQDFKFNVIEKSEKREKIVREIEERDKKIKLEKSFFQEMISTLTPTQDEEESDDEDNDNDKDKDKDKDKKVKHPKKDDIEDESSNDENKVKEKRD